MDKRQWLNWRRSKIGASDAPIVMNLSPYKTPYQLWQEKVYGTDQKQTSSMKRGNDLEPMALKCFEQKMNVFLEAQVCLENPKRTWMAATLDGFDGKTLVEIKCPNKSDHSLAASGKVPEKYIPQLQHQLEVTGLDNMYYFSFDGKDGVIVEVERDQKYIDEMVLEEEKFWKCILEEVPPEMIERDFVKRDDKWAEVAKKRYDIMQQMKELKRQDDDLLKELIVLSDGHNSIGGGLKFTRTMVKGRIDYDTIAELQSVDLEKYRKSPSTQWRLTVI